MNKNIKIKDTLLLLNTTFDMKANLCNKEPIIRAQWQHDNIYKKLLEKNKTNSKKIVFDGPPYANGDIHIGHAVNKILKDIYVRYFFSCGYYSEFIMGYDTHGLPIENKVFKNNDEKLLNVSLLRKKCKEYAISQVSLQNSQFEKLGLVFINNKKYMTLQPDYEAKQLELFFKIYEKKLVHKELKPIRWSWSSGTALAESEIEYKKIKSSSVYLKFKISSGKLKNKYVVIWTTTPWTLPGNFAICYSSDIKYSIYKYKDQEIILSKTLAPHINDLLDSNLVEIKEIESDIFKESTYFNHITKKDLNFFQGEHVNADSGTGFVHTSPFHGEDDFLIAKKHNIECNPVANKKGHMVNSGKYNDLFYLKANKEIINDLVLDNSILHKNEIIHDYPHDWRTHMPIIFLATEQWFIDIKSESNNILSFVNKVKFYPAWGKKRLLNMIENRHSWCISRQRRWGVPIPIFYDENNKPIFDKKINENIISLFKKYGSDVWFNKDINFLLPSSYDKEKTKKWTKESDIMDVWFDSGIAYEATKKLYNREINNSDYLFIEGNDQYRGWFNSSSIISGIFSDDYVAGEIMTHGFVLDKNNNKMSKSKGNVVNPLKICSTDGSDILRLWVASVDYHSDIPFSNESLKTIRDNYRKIRNTLRFLLGNISDLNFSEVRSILEDDQITIEKNVLSDFDIYIINKLNQLIKICHIDYKEYNLSAIIKKITNFCVNDLSAKYLDVSKDTIYVDGKNWKRRRQFQLTFLLISISLVKLLLPIIPHTCEEWYTSLKKIVPFTLTKSIHLLNTAHVIKINCESNCEKFKFINNDFFSSLTKPWSIATKNVNLSKISFGGVVKNKIETKLIIILKKQHQNITKNDILEVYSFASIDLLSKRSEIPEINRDEIAYSSLEDDDFDREKSVFDEILILKHPGKKCNRCWKYYDALHNNETMLCKRCSEVTSNIL